MVVPPLKDFTTLIMTFSRHFQRHCSRHYKTNPRQFAQHFSRHYSRYHSRRYSRQSVFTDFISVLTSFPQPFSEGFPPIALIVFTSFAHPLLEGFHQLPLLHRTLYASMDPTDHWGMVCPMGCFMWFCSTRCACKYFWTWRRALWILWLSLVAL